jgi:hypothetical protein
MSPSGLVSGTLPILAGLAVLTACAETPSSDGVARSAWFSRVADGGPVVTDSILSAGGSWTDYDNDGDLDLFVNGTGRNRMYRNRGDGSFERVEDEAFVTLPIATLNWVWADYDNDGFLDLYMAQSASGRTPRVDALFRGTGPPLHELVEVATGNNATVTTTATWLDYDNDGDVYIYPPGRPTGTYCIATTTATSCRARDSRSWSPIPIST